MEEDLVEQPIEDRLAEALVPELAEPEPEEDPNEPPEPVEDVEPVPEGDDEVEFVDIEIGDKAYSVPKELEENFLFQKDYTQKTQSLAEERKSLEIQQKQVEVAQKEQSFIGEIQPDLNNIGYLDATIAQMDEDLRNNLSTLTSEEMFKKKIEVDGLKDQRKAITDGLQVKYKDFQDAQEQSYRALLDQGAEILKKTIPEWNEEKQSNMRDYALSKGFTQQDVASIIDPRHVQILWAASQFEALQNGVQGAKTKLKSAPTITPKARSQKQSENDRKLGIRNKLKSTKLSDKEKESTFIQEMGERFS